MDATAACPQAKPIARAFSFKDGFGVERLEAPEHFFIKHFGGLLIVKMRKVGGGDDERVFILKSLRKGMTQFPRNIHFLCADHERQKFEFVFEDAL